LKEASKLGFTSAITPVRAKRGGDAGVQLREMSDLHTFVEQVFGAMTPHS
jgi:DNA repair protein RadA/Sms